MRSYLVNALWLIILSAFSTHSYAAETVPASVRDLIVLGLEKNIGLQVEELNIPFASETVIINEAVFDAELFAAAGYLETSTPLASSFSVSEQSDSELWSGEVGLRKKYLSGLVASLTLNSEWSEGNNLANDLDPEYRSALNLSLVQPLLRDSGIDTNTASLKISRNRYSQSELTHLLEAQALALEIESLACQLAGETAVVTLRTEAVTLAQELYDANQRRFDAGVIPVSEVQEAETALSSRRLELSLARQSRELVFERLNRQLNHALTLAFNPLQLYQFSVDIQSLNLPAFAPLFAAAREKNIYLQLGAIDINTASIRRDYSINQLKPRLDLIVQAGLNGLAGDERSSSPNSRYSGSWNDSFASAADADGYRWGAGLAFSIPLGNRSAKSRLRQSELQQKQTKYQQRDLEEELRTSLQQQLITLQRAYEQVGIAERFEQLSKISLQQEQRRLEEGLSDTFRMIFFQTNMVNAKIGRVDALTQYYLAIAKMNFVRGINLESYNISLLQPAEETSVETL